MKYIIGFPSKSVFFTVLFLLDKFICFNFAPKCFAVNVLNSDLVIYLS